MPCENFKVGPPGRMSKFYYFLSDILLGSSFLLDLPRHINALWCISTKLGSYTVHIEQCALHTSVYEPNFVDMHHNALIFLGGSNKEEEPSKISDKK